MKISTKGRYALRVMIDLAEHNTGEYIPLMDIARRQDISEKYLEAIVATLSKNDFLISLRGKGGGYKLARNPEDYSVLSIVFINYFTQFSAWIGIKIANWHMSKVP